MREGRLWLTLSCSSSSSVQLTGVSQSTRDSASMASILCRGKYSISVLKTYNQQNIYVKAFVFPLSTIQKS